MIIVELLFLLAERLTMVTERLDSLKERKMTVNADELHTQAPATENSSTVLDQVPTTVSLFEV